jgi:hypothetical protein
VRPNGSDKFQSQGTEALDTLAQTYKTEQGKLEAGRIPLPSLTPADWAKSPKIDGTTDFGGEKVQRIVADVDVPAFLKDLETGKNSDIGMRRLTASVDGNVGGGVEVDFDVKMSELDEPQEITAPAGAN